MSKHSKIGIKGEQAASTFLLNKGYIIVYKNWRNGHKEIDIIASKDDILIIVEVKTRSDSKLAFPEEAVNRKKQQLLKAATRVFMDENPQYFNVRFDIISILMDKEEIKEILHFEEAFL